MGCGIEVFSEIGRLKSVILHRPGEELNNLTPDSLEELLFDDIPYLKIAQEEHDFFAKTLRDNGVEVVYLEDLMAESLKDSDVRESFIRDYLREAQMYTDKEENLFYNFLNRLQDPKALVKRTMAGTRKSELKGFLGQGLLDLLYRHENFIANPMPNLYFTRDPFACIGKGVSLNHMWSETRNRETIYGRYIFKYHPRFKKAHIPLWYSTEDEFSIEGGDELVLSSDVLAIGISQRTSPLAIEKLARNIFDAEEFKCILAVQIPEKRAFMHLDTVFTMIDRDLFTIHPQIQGPMVVYELYEESGGQIAMKKIEDTLDKILASFLDVSHVDLLPCGGGDPVDAAREQWSDGSNTLAIAPREVVVYDRNEVTNKLLEEYGVKIHKIQSGELARGRGGPRCMSMPLIREKL